MSVLTFNASKRLVVIHYTKDRGKGGFVADLNNVLNDHGQYPTARKVIAQLTFGQVELAVTSSDKTVSLFPGQWLLLEFNEPTLEITLWVAQNQQALDGWITGYQPPTPKTVTVAEAASGGGARRSHMLLNALEGIQLEGATITLKDLPHYVDDDERTRDDILHFLKDRNDLTKLLSGTHDPAVGGLKEYYDRVDKLVPTDRSEKEVLNEFINFDAQLTDAVERMVPLFEDYGVNIGVNDLMKTFRRSLMRHGQRRFFNY